MLLESWRTAHTDQQFNAMVRMALLVTALAIVDEAPDTPSHAVRLELSKRVLGDDGFLQALTARACEVLALGGLTSESEDMQIIGAIALKVDQIAGIFSSAPPPIDPPPEPPPVEPPPDPPPGPTLPRASDPFVGC